MEAGINKRDAFTVEIPVMAAAHRSQTWIFRWSRQERDSRLQRRSNTVSHQINSSNNNSDRTARPPLFRDRISNCINLFQPNPNRTRHRIFVSMLFGGWNAAHIKLGLPFDVV